MNKLCPLFVVLTYCHLSRRYSVRFPELLRLRRHGLTERPECIGIAKKNDSESLIFVKIRLDTTLRESGFCAAPGHSGCQYEYEVRGL